MHGQFERQLADANLRHCRWIQQRQDCGNLKKNQLISFKIFYTRKVSNFNFYQDRKIRSRLHLRYFIRPPKRRVDCHQRGQQLSLVGRAGRQAKSQICFAIAWREHLLEPGREDEIDGGRKVGLDSNIQHRNAQASLLDRCVRSSAQIGRLAPTLLRLVAAHARTHRGQYVQSNFLVEFLQIMVI